MKILLAWASKYKEAESLITALKHDGHEVVYWAGATDYRGDEIPGTIIHNYADARNCIPAYGVQSSEFDPPEQSLIDRLHDAESLILTMMNKQLDWMCVDERRHLYYNLLQYWNGVIKKYLPDIIIFSLVPHTPFSYVIYALAKLLGIKTLIFDTVSEIGVPYSDRLLMCVNSWQSSQALLDALEKNKGKKFSAEDLSDDLKRYYDLHTTGIGDPTPAGVKEDKRLYSSSRLALLKTKIIASSVKDLTIFEKLLAYIQKLFRKNIKQEYISLQSAPDFSKKFIYVPLHYQPECSTSPQGGIFVDQILAIETLTASIPDDWVIYVKEHPVQWLFRGLNFFSSRYQGYYARIAKLKNVKLVPVESDHYALVGASQAVGVITGSTGFEAILRSKPALVFGYPWYMYCDGAFRVSGAKDCREALKEISAGLRINQDNTINYLKSFDDASIHGMGALSDIIGKNLHISRRESMDNIIKALLAALKTI